MAKIKGPVYIYEDLKNSLINFHDALSVIRGIKTTSKKSKLDKSYLENRLLETEIDYICKNFIIPFIKGSKYNDNQIKTPFIKSDSTESKANEPDILSQMKAESILDIESDLRKKNIHLAGIQFVPNTNKTPLPNTNKTPFIVTENNSDEIEISYTRPKKNTAKYSRKNIKFYNNEENLIKDNELGVKSFKSILTRALKDIKNKKQNTNRFSRNDKRKLKKHFQELFTLSTTCSKKVKN